MIERLQRAKRLPRIAAAAILLLVGAVGLHYLRSQWGERLTRKDIIIDRKLASPNGSMLLIDYHFDLGAIGYSATREAVVPAQQVGAELTPFRLPERYDAIRWEADNSLTVEVDLFECVLKNWDCSQTSDAFRGTRLNVRLIDEAAGKQREIEADLASPDRKLRLVAYRYPSNDLSNSGPIQISILRPGEPIPKFGNYYIASGSGDGVLGARWSGSSSIVLLTNSRQRYLLEYPESFRRSSVNIIHSVEIDDRLHGYRWISKSRVQSQCIDWLKTSYTRRFRRYGTLSFIISSFISTK